MYACTQHMHLWAPIAETPWYEFNISMSVTAPGGQTNAGDKQHGFTYNEPKQKNYEGWATLAVGVVVLGEVPTQAQG